MATDTATVRRLAFHSVEESDDGRWYLIGDRRLMSVTTACKAIAKMGLAPKAAQITTEAAFAELPTVVAASRKRPCERTNNRCRHDSDEICDRCSCGLCRACVAKWLASRHAAEWSRRADEGTRFHDVAEWWALRGEIKPHDDDIAPYVASFQQYIADYGLLPESMLMAEALVVNYDIGAAGQTDGIVRYHAERTEKAAKLVSRVLQVPWRQAVKKRLTVDAIKDYKTREADEAQFYPEHALQLAGYRHFPTVRIKNTDHEAPMPQVDAGVVVQLRPNGYARRLVVCDKDTYENGFVPALRLYEWLIGDGRAAVSSRTFVLPETVRARERKAAREAAAAEPGDAA
jgi:hypothetical protein